jgi:hypothetical protein
MVKTILLEGFCGMAVSCQANKLLFTSDSEEGTRLVLKLLSLAV